jgi:hypothetical protein
VLVMTLMVRDEGDIIRPMVEHSLAQGIDKLIVTDNGSVDGTAEYLEDLARRDDRIDLRHDPVHKKQQYQVVTAMARDAKTRYGARWVINADADEFWLPVAPDVTIADVLARLNPATRTAQVSVWDMTGAPAWEGSGLNRLVFRDVRDIETLRSKGLHAHSTENVIHVGDDRVEVAQGNHFVNLTPGAPVPPELRVEVLHLPWRSWAQFERKVSNAGAAYDANPNLQPSPNHHGMREYLRWKVGVLLATYALRHPVADELNAGIESGGLIADHRLAYLSDPAEDRVMEPAVVAEQQQIGAAVVAYERQIEELLRTTRATADEHRYLVNNLTTELADTRRVLDEIRARRSVRIADSLARLRPRR